MFLKFLMVGLGGALGSMLRFGCTLLFSVLSLNTIGATLAVNLIGSFFLGWLTGFFPHQTPFSLFLAVGLCGGFTTLSTFSKETMLFLQSGRFVAACLYVSATVVFSIVLAFLGHRLSQY